MTAVKHAQTFDEMRFAASLEPCPKCGTRELGPLELLNDGNRWTYRGPCPKCGTQRVFEFEVSGNPHTARVPEFELGPGRSEAITPEQFLRVLDDTRLPADPARLDAEQRWRAFEDAGRALTSVSELLKLVGRRGQQLAGNPRLERGALESEYDKLRALLHRLAPARTLDQKALDAHAEWLKRGARGDGQIVLDGKNLSNQHYPPLVLTAAGFLRCDMTALDVRYGRFDQAQFVADTLVRANLSGASLQQALIKGGNWSQVNLVVAKLHEIDIYDVDFTKADLDRSLWYAARITKARFIGARFGSAVLDSAVITECSFRDANLARHLDAPEPTSASATFTKCDFSGTSWAGRDLSNTRFVECTFAGAHGKPSAANGLVLESCDVDAATLLKRLV